MPEEAGTARDALAVLRRAGVDGRLVALCERFRLDLLSAFGSAVAMVDAPASDLDIAVLFTPGIPGPSKTPLTSGDGGDILGLVTALAELLGYARLDVMDLAGAGVVARSRALGPGSEPLYERLSGGYARAQMAALTTEMETERLRRLDLELLAGR